MSNFATKQIEYLLSKDLLLNSSSDIIISNNDLVTTIGNQGIKQRLRNKIFSFFYSLFAHPGWGGYFQSLVSKNMTNAMIDEARSIGVDQFMEESEVVDVPKFDVTSYGDNNMLFIDAGIQFLNDINLEEMKMYINTEM